MVKLNFFLILVICFNMYTPSSNHTSTGLMNDINNDNNDEQNAHNSNFQGNDESENKVFF